jgi:hypothetical protein
VPRPRAYLRAGTCPKWVSEGTGRGEERALRKPQNKHEQEQQTTGQSVRKRSGTSTARRGRRECEGWDRDPS